MLEHKLIGECSLCKGTGFIKDEKSSTEIDVYDECWQCEGDGNLFKSLGEDDIVYVNVYSVTRHYGGPEEGGWWFNWYGIMESIPVRNKYSEIMLEETEKQYNKYKHGNIYSVLGGRDIDVRIEATPKESETKERPYYE